MSKYEKKIEEIKTTIPEAIRHNIALTNAYSLRVNGGLTLALNQAAEALEVVSNDDSYRPLRPILEELKQTIDETANDASNACAYSIATRDALYLLEVKWSEKGADTHAGAVDDEDSDNLSGAPSQKELDEIFKKLRVAMIAKKWGEENRCKGDEDEKRRNR